jgi:hypothetical protein
MRDAANLCSVCGTPCDYHTCSTDCTLQALDTEDRDEEA